MEESTLLSIKQFSKFTGVKQSTLRYYDDIGLLPPAERGENNYRYYMPQQIITLNFISVLINLGIPLSTIKEMTLKRTPEKVIDLLSRQEEKLDYQLYELRTAYYIIHTFRNNIQAGLNSKEGDIQLENLNKMNIVLGPENDFDGQKSFYEPFINFYNSANDYKINLRYPIGAYHNDMETFIKAPGQPNRFFSIDPIGNIGQVEGKYLTAYRRGYYGQFGDIADRMDSFAKKNGLAFTGAVYVVYLLDEISVVEPENYLSRIAVGVTKGDDTRIGGKSSIWN